MTDKEFHRLFARVSRIVSFKGCRTPSDIHRRLMRKYREERHVTNGNPLERLRASNRADKIRRLVPAFGVLVIDEATSRPNGIVSQTLRFGWKKAETKFKQLREWRLDRKYKRKRR